MSLDQQQIDSIRQQFASMQNKEELLVLLNLAKSLLFEKGTEKSIKLHSLTWYSNTSLNAVRYQSFTIRKKSGGERTIHAPVGPLKTIQQCLNFVLQCVFVPHPAATGFVIAKSIADNARPHVGHPYVYNLDLKDFFPSVNFQRVKACLKLPPFNLNETREPLAFLIANLCCVRNPIDPKQAFLPQGAPTSPVLTNIVCQQLDRRLTGLAKRFGASYTRYADDMTFSSFTNVYQPGSEFCQELNRIISGQRFVINPSKTRLQRTGYRQEVTGLVVNNKVNVNRRYLRTLRAMLHNWETLGYDEADRRFKQAYALDRAYTGKKAPALLNVLMGKLEFTKMVRGQEDVLYSHYKQVFETLLAETTDQKPVELEQILDIWEEQGIEKAMILFERYKAL
ncbi:reverse transcriptase family protein [Spirosoma validum]|uniref:RNA-directed DNA polymerase n=1 Tax=Spirosoma validum TaxID=2771355 RepID=A0A927GGP8_9BACT|nr:reverse transcriptase family protein [Spirosoma validum]MBD2757104.1 RNA-directed DNA polymerase [Spirosoma validum]